MYPMIAWLHVKVLKHKARPVGSVPLAVRRPGDMGIIVRCSCGRVWFK